MIRARQDQTFNEVEEFRQSREMDTVVTLKVTPQQKRWGKKLGLPQEVRVRLVKVKLAGGTVEVLMTSLLDQKEYPWSEFHGLYKKRWEIETHFDRLKNQLELERFSSEQPTGFPAVSEADLGLSQ